MDNSLGHNNEKYLACLKRAINSVFTEKNSSIQVHRLDLDIKVSWLYFLEPLLKTKRSHSSLAEMNGEAHSLGITRDELSEMIQFYMEIGTVLYFPQNDEISYSVKDFLILNPQWLLDALTRFIFDKTLHSAASLGKTS